jgi:pimeloyl-ACP methyl ester carboxylesterase
MSITGIARGAGAHLRLISTPRLPTPGSPAFYVPPDPMPEAAPGEVLRVEAMDAYLAPGVRLRARAWRILYRSTGAVGEPTAVSGTVLVPPIGGRARIPLIGFAIGTHGIGDAAAPSRLLSLGLEWEAGLMCSVLARGYALAITDYQGLGTPGDHAYMVGRVLGMNLLDAMRAAREIEPARLVATGPAAVIGYSEGGAAAAWAAQLQPTYAPELELAGVAAGAAAADVALAGPRLNGSFFSFFLAYGGIGYAAAYPELELDAHLTPGARSRIEWLRQSNVLQAAARGPRFMRAGDMTHPNVLEQPAWQARLRENRLGTIAPQTPVLLHHARRDQIVSFDQSSLLLDDWQRLGADARLYVTRGGLDHISGALAGTPVALDWLSRRLARRRRRRRTGPVVAPAVEQVKRVA